jgi:anti-anti-sigma regulatory factor
MATNPLVLKIDGEHVVPALEEAGEKLPGGEGEVVLDFSSVLRVDPAALRAMEEFAGKAEHKSVKVVLRGVNVGVYRVLKEMRMVRRFCFLN